MKGEKKYKNEKKDVIEMKVKAGGESIVKRIKKEIKRISYFWI